MKRIDILKNVLLTATMVGTSLGVIVTISSTMAETDNCYTPISGMSYSVSSDATSRSGGSAHRVSSGAVRHTAADVLPVVDHTTTHAVATVSAPTVKPMAVASATSGAKLTTSNLVSERTSSSSAGGGFGAAASAGASYGTSGGGSRATLALSGNTVNISKLSSVSEPFADTRPSPTVNQRFADPNTPPEEEATPVGDGIGFLLLCAVLCVAVKLCKTSQRTNGVC